MNIVFVCQKGELEIKALLLAWSLRNSHGNTVRLIAAIPQYKDWNDISQTTISLCTDLSVEIKYFNPIFGDEYPIGNKISALGLLPVGELGCFLDSDMLSLSKWDLTLALQNTTSAAKPADLGTWGDAAAWDKIYKLTDLQLPKRRVRLTVNKILSYPYFNAGLVATKTPEVLFAYWEIFAKKLNEKDVALENKYPWLDQISLPIAMQHTGDWASLTEFYNYPAHLRALHNTDVGIVHYHSPSVILREPRLFGLIEKAVSEHPNLLKLINESPQWSVLIKRKINIIDYKGGERNFLITGIPRSGTSYLSSVLDSQADWLVVNEPREIFNHLQSRTDASGIELYHAECREKILLGQPIFNKVKNGKVIEDTAKIDQIEPYSPIISRSDFWMGSKNTLAYMASLDCLIDLGWPIVAMIRNPLDTLASWRNTFSHLSEAKVFDLPIANPNFSAWSTRQRLALLEIDEQDDSALRRVLLWRLLARTLLTYKDKIILWRYEDLISDPQKHIGILNTKLNYHIPIKVEASVIRRRLDQYDINERLMLLDLCETELVELNYEI
jgi:hypothetical protein